MKIDLHKNAKRIRYKGESLLEKLSDYTVIDLETTDKYINHCDIIELSAVKVRNNQIVANYSELVCPPSSIPLNIQMLTGITDEMVAKKPSIDDLIEAYIDFLGNDILLGHNIASYDTNIIYDVYQRVTGKYLKNDFLDTYRYSRYCNINTNDLKLNTIAAYYGIVNENAHRSLSDCITNHYVYQKMKKDFSLYNDASVKKNSHSSSGKRYMTAPTPEMKAVQEISETLQYIIDHDELSPENVFTIDKWLNRHAEFLEKYPFADIYRSINMVLEDGIVEDSEIEYLKKLFIVLVNPTSAQTHENETLEIAEKNICLSGDFTHGSKADVGEELAKYGAIITKSVTQKTDYLIVGDLGSQNWRCGNYGNKIKKALELQQKGKGIEIYNENEFFDKMISRFRKR